MASEIDELISILGFHEKSGITYFPVESFSSIATLTTLSRLVNRINAKSSARIHGVYVVRTRPASTDPDISENLFKPVLFIVTANSLDQAREIHRQLWNFSSAPFIIVQLPNEIRIYTGFDYDKNQTKAGLLDEIVLDEAELFDDYSAKALAILNLYSAASIDDGSVWMKLRSAPSKRFNYDHRVDKRLLKNLEELEEELLSRLADLPTEFALKCAHALIGKYVYFQYLHDREIISDTWAKKHEIDLDQVLTRDATVAEFAKLDRAIEHQFGGQIFPFPDGYKQVLNSDIISLVASIFYGDTVGQRVLFGMYDFSCIPVETLSYIYEQFLRAQGLSKKHGAVYTPESLADYLVNELSLVKPLYRGMKILDPCCGSGIFLVLAYRYLIELELKKRQVTSLEPTELRDIMEESIHGVEFNLEACYVTEFSLILILLNYLEPPDLNRYGTFKFPNLHNKNIFQGDFFDPNKEFYPLSMRFDWVLGNPPWKAIDKVEPSDANARQWARANKSRWPIGGNRIEDAFAWRATEFTGPDGVVGFVLPAKRLFNSTALKFRFHFFSQNQIRRITNFSNFHYLLFQADVSAMTVVYQNANLETEKEPIWYYSPFVANQLMAQLKRGKPTRPLWMIVVNKSEIKQVDHRKVEDGNAITWKLATWGSIEDEKVFFRLRNTFKTTLSDISDSKWILHEGVRLRGGNSRTEDTVSLDEGLAGKFPSNPSFLDAKIFGKQPLRFSVPDNSIKVVPRDKRFISKKAIPGLNLFWAPHIVLNSMYAVFSDQDFFIKNSYGLALRPHAAQLEPAVELQAYSVLLASTVSKYLLFFLSPQWGIERTKLDRDDWLHLPSPALTPRQVKKFAEFHESIVRREKEGAPYPVLQNDLDEFVELNLKLPESARIFIHDFYDLKLSLNKGKTVNVAGADKASDKELREYGRVLRNELDEFVDGETERHLIRIRYSNELVVCQINLVETNSPQKVLVNESTGKKARELFQSLRAKLTKELSQWVYVQQDLRLFDASGKTWMVYKSPRLLEWTKSQAIVDANEIVGETLHRINENILMEEDSGSSRPSAEIYR